jgi:hypothetical protein
VAGAAKFVNQFIKPLRIRTKRHQLSDSQLISCRRIPHNGQITPPHQHSAKQNQRGSRNLLAQPAAAFDCITYSRERAWKPSNRNSTIYCFRRSTDNCELQFSHAPPVCALRYICNWETIAASCESFLRLRSVSISCRRHASLWATCCTPPTETLFAI